MPGSPKLSKAGILLLDAGTGVVKRIVSLQYNPKALTRSIQPQWYEPQKEKSGADMRLQFKGPAQETINLEAEIDATDQKERPESPHGVKANAVGIHPELAALETLVYPTVKQLNQKNELASRGQMQISGLDALLTVFVWSPTRVVPVRLTEFQVNEEFFDGRLNPIQAKVSIGMRVLTVDDLGFDHHAGKLFMAYLQRRETLAVLGLHGGLDTLGVNAALAAGLS